MSNVPFSPVWTDRHADEEDLAYNLGWTSPEQLLRLRLLLEKDLNFEDSSGS